MQAWWLAYVPAWCLLYAASSLSWFLPAGLRMAALWLVPRRQWWLLALLDGAAVLAMALWRDALHDPVALALAVAGPWCIYALCVRVVARPVQPAPSPESMMRFLFCGLLAASAMGGLLALVELREAGRLAVHPAHRMLAYALGDFIGVLVVAPLIRILLGQLRGPFVPWRSVLADGLVALPLLVALAAAAAPAGDVPLYPVILALFPLFWVAFRSGWRAAAVALALLSLGTHVVHDTMLRLWRPEQLQLLFAAAGFAALAIGIAADALRTQSRALTASIDMLSMRTRALADTANRLVSQQEDERRRIGSELHDQLGQDMTAIATRLRVVERGVDDPQLREGLRTIGALVGTAHEHLRDAIQALHPLVLDRFGLERALMEGPLREMAQDHGVDFECVLEGALDQLPLQIAATVYRICQEATTNAVRHGCGGHLRIRVSLLPRGDGPLLELVVEDDAGAFELPDEHRGTGLRNIQDRADAISAAYRFDARSGRPRHRLAVAIPPGAMAPAQQDA